MSSGRKLVYNPEAVSWHRHRRSHDELRTMLFGYSVGVYCYLLRCLLMHGEFHAIRAGLGWFLGHHAHQLWKGLCRHLDAQPIDLTLAELRGIFHSPWAFLACLYRDWRHRGGRPSGHPGRGLAARVEAGLAPGPDGQLCRISAFSACGEANPSSGNRV